MMVPLDDRAACIIAQEPACYRRGWNAARIMRIRLIQDHDAFNESVAVGTVARLAVHVYSPIVVLACAC
jgi:hypothetical protein